MFSDKVMMRSAVNMARMSGRPCFFFQGTYFLDDLSRKRIKYNHLWFQATPEQLSALIKRQEELIGVQPVGPATIDLFLSKLPEQELNDMLNAAHAAQMSAH